MRSRARSSGRCGTARWGSRRSSRSFRRRRQVFRLAHQLAPLTLWALRGRLPDGEVRHEPIGRGAVPVPLAGRRVDRVAGPDLDDLAAPGLNPADPLRDVDGLADGVGVPRIARAGCEADDVDADARWLLATGDDVVPRVPGEGFGRRLDGGLGWLDLHRRSPLYEEGPLSPRAASGCLPEACRAARRPRPRETMAHVVVPMPSWSESCLKSIRGAV